MRDKTQNVVQKAVRKGKKAKQKEPAMGSHALLKGFVFSAVFILMVLVFVPVGYDVNDEFGIIVRTLNEQGGVRPDPDSSRTFLISQAFNDMLYVLYQYWPSMPWLGVFMLLAVYVGSSLILGLILRTNDGKYALLAIPPWMLFVGYCSSFMSVTAAALLLEFGVFLCLMEWTLKGRPPVRRSRWFGVFLVFCLILSFFLRWRLALYATGLAFPVLLFLKTDQVRQAMPFALAFFAIVAGDRLLFHYTSTDEHKAFITYNLIRAEFNDTMKGQYHGDMTLKALDKAGWTLDDYGFFRCWILYDEKVFNPETIRVFTKENDPQDKASLMELIPQRILKSFDRSKGCTLVLVFSLMSLFLYRFQGVRGLSRRDRLRMVCVLGTIGAGIVFFMYYRFPARFFIPLYTYLLVSAFLVFQIENKALEARNDLPKFKKIALISILLLVSLALGQIYTQGKGLVHVLASSKRQKDYIHKCLAMVKDRSLHGAPLLVLMDPSYGLHFEGVHPLKELADFPDLRIFPTGSRINSPDYFHRLRRLGLKGGREFLKWVVNNEDALLVLMVTEEKRRKKMTYLWRSYLSRRIVPGRKVRLLPVYDFRNRNDAGLVFYRAVSAV